MSIKRLTKLDIQKTSGILNPVGHVEQARVVPVVEHRHQHRSGFGVDLPCAGQSNQAQVGLQGEFRVVRTGGIGWEGVLSVQGIRLITRLMIGRIEESGAGLFGKHFQASRLELSVGNEHAPAQFVIAQDRGVGGDW